MLFYDKCTILAKILIIFISIILRNLYLSVKMKVVIRLQDKSQMNNKWQNPKLGG